MSKASELIESILSLRRNIGESTKDKIDLKKLVKKLKTVGKEYSYDDKFGLGSERFSRETRKITNEIAWILDDNHQLVGEISKDLYKYFDNRLFNGKTIQQLSKIKFTVGSK